MWYNCFYLPCSHPSARHPRKLEGSLWAVFAINTINNRQQPKTNNCFWNKDVIPRLVTMRSMASTICSTIWNEPAAQGLAEVQWKTHVRYCSTDSKDEVWNCVCIVKIWMFMTIKWTTLEHQLWLLSFTSQALVLTHMHTPSSSRVAEFELMLNYLCVIF